MRDGSLYERLRRLLTVDHDLVQRKVSVDRSINTCSWLYLRDFARWKGWKRPGLHRTDINGISWKNVCISMCVPRIFWRSTTLLCHPTDALGIGREISAVPLLHDEASGHHPPEGLTTAVRKCCWSGSSRKKGQTQIKDRSPIIVSCCRFCETLCSSTYSSLSKNWGGWSS